MSSLKTGLNCAAPEVAVLGLRYREFCRLLDKARRLPIQLRLVYGGHLGDGSNCSRQAIEACSSATLVLWCREGLRKLPAGFAPTHRMILVQGVSSAFNEIKSFTQCA